MRILITMITLMALCTAVQADDRRVGLYVPDTLVETGLLRYILPRFTLKTQVKVDLLATREGADMVWGEEGTALFQQGDITWRMRVQNSSSAGTARFAQWLSGEIGQRTLMGFAPEGQALFSPALETEAPPVQSLFEGDAKAGYATAKGQCGRCHAVDEAGRMTDIGSTPSFFLLRSLEDWEERFSVFYTLRPHGAFTQIDEVTEPFAINLPPAIIPIRITLGELDNIIAYTAGLKPADLGAPLVHQ